MYAQFALVIAATALLSAINAVTLKPTQARCGCARRCRRSGATFSIAASTPSMRALERGYAGLIGRMVAHAGPMTAVAFVDHRGCRYGDCRACRPVSCRSRIRAICWSASSFRMARRWSARSRRSNRSRRSRARTRASPGDHHRRRLGRSTTARRSPMPASPISCSRTGASATTCARCSARCRQASTPIDASIDRAAAAADPGHRQCRRLHHAGRIARRQLRSRQAAKHHQCDCRQCAVAERAAARLDARSARPRRNCASRSIA